MAKDTFYFSHDYNARNDDKILELRSNYGAEGYGIFWMLVEAMAEGSEGGLKASLIGGLSLGFGIPKNKLIQIIDICVEVGLFYERDGFYYSKRLQTHKEFRNSLSEWGKKGAEKKRGSQSPPDSPPSTNKGNEMKGNESNTGVAPEMFKIFKKHNSKYPHDKEKDFTSCLQLAYKIADYNNWERKDVLSSKKNDVLVVWEKITEFVVSDKWFSTRALFDLNSEWQRLVQSMNGKLSGISKERKMVM